MSGPTLGKALEAGLAGEGAQDAANPRLGVDSTADSTTTVGATDAHVSEKPLQSQANVVSDGDATRVGSNQDLAKAEKGEDVPVEEEEGSGILKGAKLLLVFIAMLLVVFLFALDQSIVATALPIIASDFNAFDQVGWVVTGYFLTQSGFILLVGQSLTIFKAKHVLLVAMFLFELGSLIAGVAKSMPVLILGRAVQGVGCSGLFTSVMQIITVITTVRQRPGFMAGFGLAFVVSSVVGPLLGGVFTQHVTWRWCFYINLPFGGVAAAAIVWLLPARNAIVTEHTKGLTTVKKLTRLDYVGAFLILAIVTCLLLALQWGGNQYRWGSWRIIFLFILSGVLIGIFIGWNYVMDTRFHRGLIPLAVLKNRTLIAGSIAIFMTMLTFLGSIYQLPLYYEAVKNHSPTKAGIDILPLMIATVISMMVTGGLSQKTGHYLGFILTGFVICAPGFGLLYTLSPDTPAAKVIGYQILVGAGLGMSFQLIIVSVQAEFAVRPAEMPSAVGIQTFTQLTGAALGIGIINTVESVYLNRELKVLAPSAPFALVRNSVSAIYTLPPEIRASVIKAYVIAIDKCYIPVFIAVSLAFVSSAFIKNYDLRVRGPAAMGAAA